MKRDVSTRGSIDCRSSFANEETTMVVRLGRTMDWVRHRAMDLWLALLVASVSTVRIVAHMMSE